MSEAYLSWQTKRGLVDAGKIEALASVVEWPRAGPQLRLLLAGKPVDATQLESEFASAVVEAFLAGEVQDDDNLRVSLESILRALVARRPRQTKLLLESSDSESYEEPHLLDWVKLNTKPTPRLNLLLRLQTALDTDPYDEDLGSSRDLNLVACLQLLPDFPK